MDYRQLHLFLTAAERLNLSHAADAMNMTQPGLSKSMHRLQRELGTKLSWFSLWRLSCFVGANSRQCATRGPSATNAPPSLIVGGCPLFPVACSRRQYPPDIASGSDEKVPAQWLTFNP
jgi:Bacterial regulatory helix-turn-helix protein, lysR family